MANTIKIKRSSTASDTPSASDLEVGELAVNTADAKLFTKHTDGSVKELAGGGGGTGDITAVTAGNGLSGGGDTGAVTLAVDLSELTDMTQTIVGTDEFIVLDNGADRRKAANEIPLSIFNNDSGFITSADGGNAQTLDSLDSTSFLRSDAADTKTSGDLTFSDDVKAIFGDGSDLKIFHDGSKSKIADTSGTGALIIASNEVQIKNASDNEDIAKFTQNGAVELYHDNSKKIETTSTGATVTGTAKATVKFETDDVTVGFTSNGATSGSGNFGVASSNGGARINADSGSNSSTFIDFDATNISASGGDITYRFGRGTTEGSSDLSELIFYAHDGTNNPVIRLRSTGELIASSLDISGNVDIDGTLEADAITLNGTSLASSATTDTTDASNISSGTLNADRLPDLTVSELAANSLTTSSESFADNDTTLMTSAAINDRIESCGYSKNTGTVKKVGTTGTVNGITLTGTVTSSGNLTLGGTLGSITVSQLAGSALTTSSESFADNDTTLMTSAAINDRIESFGYITSADGGNAQTLDSLDSTSFLRSDAADTKTSGNLTFSDSVKLIFGTSDDGLEIVHDGNNSRIKDTGTGSLLIEGSFVGIGNPSFSENMAKFFNNGAVELYHDNDKKIETTSSGASITGDLILTSTDAGATENPTLDLYRNSASPADQDVLGHINFSGEDSAGNKTVYAKINADIIDQTDGTEDGRLDFGVIQGGTFMNRLIMKGSGVTSFVNKDVEIGSGIVLRFEGSTADTNETSLTVVDPTADRTITLPDASGTVLLTDGDGSNLTGITASTATTATNVTVSANNSTNESVFLTFVDGATGTQGIETDTDLTYNPSTNALSAGSFVASGVLSGQTLINLGQFTAIGPILVTNEIKLSDSVQLQFGTGSDTRCFHDGSKTIFNANTSTAGMEFQDGGTALVDFAVTSANTTTFKQTVDFSNATVTGLSSTGASKGFAVAMAIAL